MVGNSFEGVVYTLDDQGSLLWWKLNGAAWAPNSGSVIRTGMPAGTLAAGSNGVLYVLTEDGQVYWYKDLANDGSSNWDANSGAVILLNMDSYESFAMGGDGVTYIISTNDNDLHWGKNWFEGSPNLSWTAPRLGYPCFKDFWQASSLALIPSGDGIVYLLDSSGNLQWFRDTANNGLVSPDPGSGTQVASGLPTEPLASGWFPVWAGENGAFYSIAGGVLQVHQLSIGIDGSLSVTSSAGPPWTSTASSAASPLTATNVGTAIVALANGSSSPFQYPEFSGTQLACYEDICAQVGEKFGSSSFDLRKAYGDPISYPPSELLTNISDAKPKQKESKSDWDTVQQQVETEATQLGVIYTYQTSAGIAADAVSNVYQLSYQTATGNISGGGDLDLDVLSILSFLAIPGFEVEGYVCQMAGLLGSILQAANNTVLTGPLSQLNLSSVITGILDNVTGLYQQLQPDWGMVQAANAVLQNAASVPPTPSYQAMGDAYEVGLYLTYARSNMCILFANQWKGWGACGGNGVGLANVPDPDEGPNGVNGNVCARLTTLGVVQQNIINRAGPWSALPSWQCTWFTDPAGWSCELNN